MGRPVRVARVTQGQVPSVLNMPQKNTATFKVGAAVVATAGLIDECGVNPATILGFALAGANSWPGLNAANSPTVVTGVNTTNPPVAVAVANDITWFSAPLTNGSSAYIVPSDADLNAQYGLTAYGGEWTVDKAKTAANARVIVEDYDLDSNVVIFRVLAANQAA